MFILKKYFNKKFEFFFHVLKLKVMLKELRKNVKKSMVKSNGLSLSELDNDKILQVIIYEKMM